MIDAGPLTHEDADEYRITLDDISAWAQAITTSSRADDHPGSVTLTMTNHDALELAAQLLIGAVYNASDADYRYTAWQQLLAKRLGARIR